MSVEKTLTLAGDGWTNGNTDQYLIFDKHQQITTKSNKQQQKAERENVLKKHSVDVLGW